MPRRILGLELLRGLCALMVALYHCLWWSKTAQFPSWGLYGVPVFFGISGAVLYHNYADRLSLDTSIPQFLLRRFARLFPLLAACMLIPAVVRGIWEPGHYFLDLSLLFGLGAPGRTGYLTGSWSLGIEFALYALFPVLLTFATSVRTALATLVVFLILRIAFVDFLLKGETLVQAWPAYIQPAAFLVFFFGGMVIAKVSRSGSLSPTALWTVGAVSAVGLFAFPGANDEEVILGMHGFTSTLLTLALVAAFFCSPLSSVGAKVCQFFGDISYGLYLMHPIVWTSTQRDMPAMTPVVHILVTLGISVAAAWLSLKFYERPLRSWIIGLASRETKEGVKKLAG